MGKHIFYKWSRDDFVEIPADKLHVGDEISYGYGRPTHEAYGATPITKIQIIAAGVFIEFPLPVGAKADSTNENDILVTSWAGKIPRIIIMCRFEHKRGVLIRHRRK
jgi:hypothetical protein